MDPLSEIFNSMQIRSALYVRLEATTPWGLKSIGGPEIKFVLVVRGSAILTTKAQVIPINLSGGDLLISLDDSAYSICDNLDSPITDCCEVEKIRVGNLIEFGGGGAQTTIICGYFGVDSLDAKPLLAVLPKILHLRLDQNRSNVFQSVMELLATEIAEPGLASEALISRLYELLFVHAIRAYTSGCTGSKGGWLAAMAHKQIGEAIKAMHADLNHNWTVESLAEKAGMSRSAFAAKFKLIVGRSPLEYLTQWRMHKAGILIRKESTSLSEISYAVGYKSESAFNRVFKKEMGIPPGEFRKNNLNRDYA